MSETPRIVVGRDGRIMLVNERAQSLLGFAEEELLGRHSEEIVAADERAGYVRAREAFLAEPAAGPLSDGLTQLITRTGAALAVTLQAQPLLAAEELWVSLSLQPAR